MKKLMLFLGMVLFLSSFASAESLTNAKLYFSYDDDEYDSPTVIDASGNNNGTNSGATSGAFVVLREAFDIDVSDTISVPGYSGTTENIGFWMDITTPKTSSTTCEGIIDDNALENNYLSFGSCAGIVSGEVFMIVTNDAGTAKHTYTTSSISTGVHFFELKWNSTDGHYNIYIDNIKQSVSAGSNGHAIKYNPTGITVSSLNQDGTRGFDNDMDELSMYADALTPSQSSRLYNGDDAFNPYKDSVQIQLTASNLYNGSSISTFNATITNATTSSTIETTNGSIFWPSGQIVNITVEAEDYFTRTYTDVNTSTNLDAELWQAVLIVNAREKFTNSTITDFNVTSTDGVYTQFNTSNASGNITLLVNADTYNLTGKAAMYDFNATNESISVSFGETRTVLMEFVSRELNVSAVNNITDESLDDFTVQIRNDSLGILYNVTTTDGLAQLYAVEGIYDVTLFAEGYAARTDVVYLENASQNYVFQLFASESIFINIYDLDSADLITQNVSLEFITGDDSFTNYTVTGGFFIANLTPGLYTIWADSENYTKTAYSTTVTEGSNQTLNIYLLSSSFVNEVTFIFQDRDIGNKLEGVSVAVTRVVGSQRQLINTYQSDIVGRISFTYEQNVQYCFMAVLEDYETKEWCLNNMISTSPYTVIMEAQSIDVFTGDYTDIDFDYDPFQFNEGSNGYNISILSPAGKLQSYSFAFYYESTLLANNTGDSTTGQIFSGTLTVPDADYGDSVKLIYSYDPTYGSEKNYAIDIPIIVNGTQSSTIYGLGKNTYGLSLFERAFVVFIVALLLGTVAHFAGGLPASGFICVVIVGAFIRINFIDIWTGGITLVVCTMIWLFGAGR